MRPLFLPAAALASVLLSAGCAMKPAPVKKVSQASKPGSPAPALASRPAAVWHPGSGTVSPPPTTGQVLDPAGSIPLIPLEQSSDLTDPGKTKISGSVSVSVGYDNLNTRADHIGRNPSSTTPPR